VAGAFDEANASPFLSWEWISAWHKWLGWGKLPRPLCAREGDVLVGLLPLSEEERRLKGTLARIGGDRKKAGEILEEPSYKEDRNGFAGRPSLMGAFIISPLPPVVDREFTSSKAPSLGGHYSASSLLRTSPPPS
jgi:hypothetical protein